MKKPLEQLDDGESAGWITTFADLMTLLLVFFVLLFSMSTVEVERFQQVVASLQVTFGDRGASNSIIELPHTLPEAPEVEDTTPDPQPEPAAQGPEPETAGEGGEENAISEHWLQLAKQLRATVDRSTLGHLVDIDVPLDGKLVIEVQGTALFDSGSADLNYEVDEVLESLLKVFRVQHDFDINIQGHTDNLPISTSRYETNWELSAIRATTVLRYFINRGISPRRLTATGYGDSLPIASNDTPAGRARNRRIEFVLEKRQITDIR